MAKIFYRGFPNKEKNVDHYMLPGTLAIMRYNGSYQPFFVSKNILGRVFLRLRTITDEKVAMGQSIFHHHIVDLLSR